MTPVAETERLIIRHFTPADLDDFAALCANPQIMQMMGDGQPLPRERVAQWIDICQQNYASIRHGVYAVTLKADGSLAGFCGIGNRQPKEIVYGYQPQLWGQGIATEAARAILTAAFESAGLPQVYASIDPANEASARVLAKLGFVWEREEPDEDLPGQMVHWYVLEKASWPG